MDLIHKILDYIAQHPEFTLLGSITLIQIAPIKINPWIAVLRLIRGVLVGELAESIEGIKKDLLGLRQDVEQEKADNKRWNILDFANSCRNGRRHTKDEWHHVIDQLKDYETFVNERGLDNGVMEEEAKYLRRLYAERCEKNDFL